MHTAKRIHILNLIMYELSRRRGSYQFHASSASLVLLLLLRSNIEA